MTRASRLLHPARFLLDLSGSSHLARLCTAVKQRQNLNVGTIGHVDHGKTTLTAAITKYCSRLSPDGRFVSYEEIDKAPEEKRRGITINIAHVPFSTPKRDYAHTDCPGHVDFIKNMLTGAAQIEAAVLVVAATDGVMPQTREHLLLARNSGVEALTLFINKADLVDSEILELVEFESIELMEEFGYKDVPTVKGSALRALSDDEAVASSEFGVSSIKQLLDTLDEIPQPERDLSSPLQLPVEGAVSIKGRGTVVTGTVRVGTLKKGEAVELVGYGETISAVATDLQVFNQSVNQVVAGQNCGVLLRGIRRELVSRGMLLTTPKAASQTDLLEAQVYVLSSAEGGRSKPLMPGYQQPLFSKLWTQECMLTPAADRTMLMPGEPGAVTVRLRQPMPLQLGDRFTVRENHATVLTGLVTKLLPRDNLEIAGFNKVTYVAQHKVESNAQVVRNKKR